MRNVELIPVTATQTPFLLPLFSCRISAGFPSPASDHLEELFDLNRLLLRHPDATYLVRVSGESMRDAEIHDAGDVKIWGVVTHVLHEIVPGKLSALLQTRD